MGYCGACHDFTSGPRRGEPQPPEDVRVILPDGHEIPCELFYDGLDDEGNHMWRATATLPALAGIRITCKTLPPHTGLWFQALPTTEE